MPNTMSSINSLLNHEAPGPSPSQRARSGSGSDSDSMHHQHRHFVAKTTTYEAADALTTLATLGSGQQYAPVNHAPTRELPSPTAFAHAPRRTSSFGSHIASIEPVEPSPPIDHPQHSPTLDQYHHGSKSPETQRRQSLLTRTSPAPILAPIKSFSPVQDPPQQPPVYGKDVSQTAMPQSQASDEGLSSRDETHDREPAYVVETPTTAQPTASAPHPIVTSLPPSHHVEQRLPSPLPLIKPEPSGTPREATPATNVVQSLERNNSVTGESIDTETLKAIEIAKTNDLGLRAKRNASVTESVTSPIDSKTAPAFSKKRPAPSSSSIKKKGTAAPKKPTSKRRKIETDTESNPRSATPTSRTSKPGTKKGGNKGSQAGTPAAESSPAPDHSSQAHPSDDEGESSEDSALYCICRKPDNHKWMIGCDGGCDDWFHGSCVNMQQADEALVDKFICPNCEQNDRGQTTYKPMCRRDGCRKPARLSNNKLSKYCSDECGVGFFQDQLQRTAGAKKPSTSKKLKKKGNKEGEDQENLNDEEEPTPLGGVLRAKDLKALVEVTKDIDAFKRLGSGVLSPPQTASPTKATFDGLPNGTSDNNIDDGLKLTAAEQMHLGALHTEKSHLNDRLEVLKDREKFVSMAREQATRYADKEKIKVKEFCGYDSRLSWSDAEFLHWRKSKVGRASFQFGTLSPTDEEIISVQVNGSAVDKDGDSPMDGTDDEPKICNKKRCPKHPQWQKLNLQDARFEELEVVEAIKECEKEERSVRERARRRGEKDTMASDLIGADGGSNQQEKERNRDGWVEVVS
jgi:COMPASS component SPP1